MTATLLLLLACVSGDDDTKPDPSDDSGEGEGEGEAADYASEGPYEVETGTGSEEVDTDCALAWTRYAPVGVDSGGTVILAHGFSRAAENMSGHAEHLASWGLTVLTPDLCHSSFTDADHVQNGLDLVALATALGADAPLYAGHSAGGLAALVAAAEDDGAQGVLGLDPVNDFSGSGSGYGARVTAPVAGLFGESSACNSNNNGVEMYTAAPDATAMRVTEADHCDFENPTDSACTAFCAGTNEAFSDADIQSTVITMATAWLLWRSGLDAGGAAWWTPGEAKRDSLESGGAISEL